MKKVLQHDPPQTETANPGRNARTGKLSEVGEINAIKQLIRNLHWRTDIAVPAGDDCAVARLPGYPWDLLLTTDPIVEGTHFDSSLPPTLVGAKAINRTLSDIAAMGGEPLWVLVNVVAPPTLEMATLRKIYRGARKAVRRFGVEIVGGDLSQGKELQIHVFGIGRAPRGKAVLRSGASPGDKICVTGSLGGSIVGRHASFQPRINEGLFLRNWATAMIDVSDGLAADIQRLAEASGVGATINVSTVPISRVALALNDGRTPLRHAIEDGEDFELLFTIPSNRSSEFKKAWRKIFELRCTEIGVVTPRRQGVRYVDSNGRELKSTFRGFTHFSTQQQK